MTSEESAAVCTSVPREEVDFSEVSESTRAVYVYDRPFVWAIEEILRRAPNLRRIEVPPFAHAHLPPTVRRLLTDRGVEVVAKWKGAQRASHIYRAQRQFFLDLDESGKEALREIVSLGLAGPKLAARYLCLEGEPYIPLHRVVAEAGSGFSPSAVAAWVAAIRRHLDPSQPIAPSSEKYLHWLQRRLEKERAEAARRRAESDLGAAWDELLGEVGLTLADLPAGLPVTQRARFVEVARAKRDGRLAALAASRPKEARALAARYGLDGAGVYRTFDAVADELGVTRQRVQQLEGAGLRHLESGVPRPIRDEAAVEEVASAFRDGRASSLTDKQAEVLRLRFGVEDGCVRTLASVAEMLEIHLATVHQRERAALQKIRAMAVAPLEEGHLRALRMWFWRNPRRKSAIVPRDKAERATCETLLAHGHVQVEERREDDGGLARVYRITPQGREVALATRKKRLPL